jgi:electron transport complex protein RnfD
MNPALIGRAFLLASYPTLMSGSAFHETNFGNIAYDGVTSATPLTAIKAACKAGETVNISSSDIVNALIGNIGGTIGEVCAIALILGGIYLIARKVISWRIPVVYILTVFVLTYVFKLFVPVAAARVPVYELFTGGLMLGAFFMATDYASSPVTPKGQLIMGFGCGLITVLIRIFGGYPEGVSYSILLMNCCVPLIDRWTRPRIFGEVKK